MEDRRFAPYWDYIPLQNRNRNRKFNPLLFHVRPDGQGFTLLEVLIALSVIAIALVGVYQLYTQNLIMAESQRFHSLAPLLAQNKLAEIEIDGEEGLDNGSGSFSEEYPGFTWEVEINETVSEVLGDFATGLRRIDLTVGYNQDEFTYHVRTYRHIPES